MNRIYKVTVCGVAAKWAATENREATSALAAMTQIFVQLPVECRQSIENISVTFIGVSDKRIQSVEGLPIVNVQTGN